ncbi:MAG: hypothetical protein K5892_01505 [Acholeplasmatales bacterium]|nr:hypothetical protein [Acholeplasmatales bacterium]
MGSKDIFITYHSEYGGGYTINFVSFEIYEENSVPTVASIDATVTAGDASISISDVKSTDTDGNIISYDQYTKL